MSDNTRPQRAAAKPPGSRARRRPRRRASAERGYAAAGSRGLAALPDGQDDLWHGRAPAAPPWAATWDYADARSLGTGGRHRRFSRRRLRWLKLLATGELRAS